MITSSQFCDDRPIEATEQDKLGYIASARHIAKAILEFSPSGGFVLGLEGLWGSGKTSFANLVIASLRQASPAPEIVKFSPWLIKSRDGLLTELFQEVALAAERIDTKDTEDPLDEARGLITSITGRLFRPFKRRTYRIRLKRLLSSFSSRLVSAGKLIEIAENVGVPYASVTGRSIQWAGSAAETWGKAGSLESEKRKLVSELRKLGRQIVIFVDDLDRLEPSETAEIVRLVRAVADFPNVTYVLCYSRATLAQSLEQAFKLEDGAEYIEKIVQVTFSVPKPEDFDLRRMFRDELLQIFPAAGRDPNSAGAQQQQQRFASVIDVEGGRSLGTPRDVARCLNALRLYAGPIIDKIDLADMVWLQLTRLGNEALYNWVETYVNSLAAISAGAQMRDAGKKAVADKLVEALGNYEGTLADQIYQLARILPGISVEPRGKADRDAHPSVFQTINTDTLAPYVASKRLGSPQHFRFYFALAKPSGAIEDADYAVFLRNCVEDVDAAIAKFAEWAGEIRTQGGVMAEAVMDRLAAEMSTDRVKAASPGIFQCLANAMDIAAIRIGRGYWGRYWIWNEAGRLFKASLANLDQAQRADVIGRAFRDGRALGWLTTILRGETHAPRRPAGDREGGDQPRLTMEECATIQDTLITRYRKAAPDNLLNTPDFLNLLFAWLEAGPEGEREVKSWVNERIADDNGMLTFLDRTRSWSARNDEVIYPVRQEDLRDFLDYPAVHVRVQALAHSEDRDVRKRAEAILEAMHQGGDDL